MKASDAKKLVAEFEAKKKLVPLYDKSKEATLTIEVEVNWRVHWNLTTKKLK